MRNTDSKHCLIAFSKFLDPPSLTISGYGPGWSFSSVDCSCNLYFSGKHASLSPVVKTFLDLQKRKRTRKGCIKQDTDYCSKATRRLYIGWKHEIRLGTFKLVSASRGGGQQIIDSNKEFDYSSLLKEIKEIYFPNGISLEQNMKIDDISCYLASFSGAALPKMEDEGGFTVGKYFKSLKTSPVRIYLHTQIQVWNMP